MKKSDVILVSEFIEQSMWKLKLSKIGRKWRGVQQKNTEQYITDLQRLEQREHEINRINRTESYRLLCNEVTGTLHLEQCH